ncbi:MAG: class I SAM-dependent methyltransferase, partial [Chitinispirillales bacterium]|nr:class I SAM-dependent methyltransferase [Chitinispirillales bacterium]
PPPPQPDAGAEFDKVAHVYNEDTVEALGKFGKYRDTAFTYKCQYLKSILPKEPAGILDFGCGVGSNVPYLKKYFPNAKLFGCDVSPESIKIARANYEYCDFRAICVPNDLSCYKGKVDVVFVSTVFHHIPPAEHEKWLDGLYSIMKSGDYLVIFEHNVKNPITAKVVKNPIDEDAVMLDAKYCAQLVKSRFHGTSIKNKVIRTGGGNVKLRYTYFFPWRNRLFTEIERLLYFIPLGAQYCVHARKR